MNGSQRTASRARGNGNVVESTGIEPVVGLRPDRSNGTNRPPTSPGRRNRRHSRVCRSIQTRHNSRTPNSYGVKILRSKDLLLTVGGGRGSIHTTPVSNHTASPCWVAGYYPIKKKAPVGIEPTFTTLRGSSVSISPRGHKKLQGGQRVSVPQRSLADRFVLLLVLLFLGGIGIFFRCFRFSLLPLFLFDGIAVPLLQAKRAARQAVKDCRVLCQRSRHRSCAPSNVLPARCIEVEAARFELRRGFDRLFKFFGINCLSGYEINDFCEVPDCHGRSRRAAIRWRTTSMRDTFNSLLVLGQPCVIFAF